MKDFKTILLEQSELPKKLTYGIDLDGTLAKYDGWKGKEYIGDPIPKMIDRVKTWIKNGITIVIFTARAENQNNIPYVKKWLDANGLKNLKITNRKTHDIKKIYDDRAVQVKKNTGKLIKD